MNVEGKLNFGLRTIMALGASLVLSQASVHAQGPEVIVTSEHQMVTDEDEEEHCESSMAIRVRRVPQVVNLMYLMIEEVESGLGAHRDVMRQQTEQVIRIERAFYNRFPLQENTDYLISLMQYQESLPVVPLVVIPFRTGDCIAA